MRILKVVKRKRIQPNKTGDGKGGFPIALEHLFLG